MSMQLEQDDSNLEKIKKSKFGFLISNELHSFELIGCKFLKLRD
jgi:hypothetical protein